MTTTDELRRMLDERGVEWWDSRYGELVVFKVDGVNWYANDSYIDGMLELSTVIITPEQAIAATLGGGKLTAEQVEKAIRDCSAYASYDGCTYYASGIKLQAIADELNATLGSSRESELRDALNEVADKWAQAQIKAEDYAKENALLKAKLGAGECELEIKDNMNESEGTGAVWWECSSCHWQIEFFHSKWLVHAKFCPECGRKIRKAVKR